MSEELRPEAQLAEKEGIAKILAGDTIPESKKPVTAYQFDEEAALYHQVHLVKIATGFVVVSSYYDSEGIDTGENTKPLDRWYAWLSKKGKVEHFMLKVDGNYGEQPPAAAVVKRQKELLLGEDGRDGELIVALRWLREQVQEKQALEERGLKLGDE